MCTIRDYSSCPFHQIGIPFQCSPLNPTTCGCIESSIMSKVTFIIDNTGFTNDYSWYFWAIEWIKLYQTKVLINQPLIMKNVTYIHIGDTKSQYKVTRNYNQFTNTQIIPNSIYNSWTIPPILQNNSPPNFCDALSFALQLTPFNELEDLIIIYFANSSPSFPNAIATCNASGYENMVDRFKNLAIPLYIIRSSINVNVTYIQNEFKINLLSTMVDEYNNDTDNWGSVYDETENMYSPNHQKTSEYMNAIVSTSADFICQYSELCDAIVYASGNDKKCRITCTSMDNQCLTNMRSSKYYITKSYSGLDMLDMTQNEANKQCLDTFGSHLATLQSKTDFVSIAKLMNYMHVNECWIGINETAPLFTIDNTEYFQWMDGNINSFPNFTATETSTNNCIFMNKIGLQVANCNETFISCSICNVKDDPVVTAMDDRNFLIHSDKTLTWKQADTYCMQQFNTHLSTIQLQSDLNSINSLSAKMTQIAETLNNIQSEFQIWTGQKIFISYDDCLDFWNRTFNIIYADGSHHVFNNSLINLKSIIIQTCAPTAAPTNAPTFSPTTAPTFSPTRAPTNAPTRSPTDSPTESPTNAPTSTPTRAPTYSPTLTPTRSPGIDRSLPTPSPTPGKDFIIIPSRPILPFQTETLAPTNTPTYPLDPFTPTKSPLRKKFSSPREPSPAPTSSPTSSPLYVSSHCVSLQIKLINTTEFILNTDAKQYEYKWITQDCGYGLSSWSCNVNDRADYQQSNDDYYVLMDDMSKSNGKAWIEANNYCHNIFGTSLATIYDTNDQLSIINMKNDIKTMYDIDVDDIKDEAIWIGMILENSNFAQSKLTWSDKSISNYSNLVSGCAAIDGNNQSLWTLQRCNEYNRHYIWSCNQFVPTAHPTKSPTFLIKEIESELSVFEEIYDWITTYPFELIYILVLVTCCFITIFAFFHAKSSYCCCDGCVISYADDAKYVAALLFGLQFWDFLSDISFAYNLPNKSDNIIFFLSVIFIVVPWSINIIFLLIYRYNWSNNAEVGNWLREHISKLVFVTMICGGAQTSVELMNSRIFALNVFQMGLSRMQLIETGKFKVLLTTVLENIPQILICTYWMLQTGFNNYAVASLISSTCSVILVIAATILIRMDNLHDEQIEFVLDYKLLKKGKKNDKKANAKKLNKIGMHSRLATCIANVLDLNPNMVYIDKHVIGLATITLNVSITHAFNDEQKEEEEEDDEEGAENMISTQSVIYKLRGDQCEQILNGIIEILGIDKNDIMVNNIMVIPLDYNGAKLDVCKKTHFDERLLKRDKTEWCYREKTNLLQLDDYINILPDVEEKDNGTPRDDDQKDNSSSQQENSLLLDYHSD